jgi:hypothetical protein
LAFESVGGGVMEFENNWAYPWPNTAYDPVLKARMSISSVGRDAEVDDVSIRIDYDPQIVAGRYIYYLTEEEKRTSGLLPKYAEKPRPFWSPTSENIITMWRPQQIGAGDCFRAHNEIHGAVRRIKLYRDYIPGKVYGPDPLKTLNNKVDYIKAGNYPIISQYPKDFLLYAFKNYIGLSDLNGLGFPPVPNTSVKRIEMCLHAVVMTKFFQLSLNDFEQVESGWYCISALELKHESV